MPGAGTRPRAPLNLRETIMTRTRTFAAPFLGALLLLGLAGCADLDPTTQRTMTGGIGAGVGAGGGFLYDRHVQSRDRAFQRGVEAGRAQPR